MYSMLANFPTTLFYREADKCFGIYMLINPWKREEGRGSYRSRNVPGKVGEQRKLSSRKEIIRQTAGTNLQNCCNKFGET
jgi:hypothetical protein